MNDHITKIISQVPRIQEAVIAAAQGTCSGATFERSCLMTIRKRVKSCAQVLVFDIGGTHSRIVLDSWSREERMFQILLDELNHDLLRASPTSTEIPLMRLLTSLLDKGVVRTQKKIDGVGLIWSNQFKASPLNSGATHGVTGVISGIAAGSYQKGEWFTEGLTDGFDIGGAFLKLLSERGITPKVFILANDTVATFNAEIESCGGVVASTGANCAALSPEGEIANTELGSLFTVTSDFLEESERPLFENKNIPLEAIIAGAFLVPLFNARIKEALPAMVPLHSTRELATLLIDPTTHSKAREIATDIIERAGAASALLVVGSLALGHPDELQKVVIDSSLARAFPIFWQKLEETTQKILPHVELELKSPYDTLGGGEVSVPTQGLGLTVASYLES